jgi:hypothetical protein
LLGVEMTDHKCATSEEANAEIADKQLPVTVPGTKPPMKSLDDPSIITAASPHAVFALAYCIIVSTAPLYMLTLKKVHFEFCIMAIDALPVLSIIIPF